MIPLRNKVPKRRTTTTKNPTGNNWTDHKADLKEDFNSHCAYCDSFDGFRNTYYEVDHFIPKDFFKQFGNIGVCQYDNLVYSCKFCNNAKRAKWPTQSEILHNDGSMGFVDPCLVEYDTHFYRTIEGAIMWKTDLGKWMYKEAFKFDERERSLIVLWNLNRLRLTIQMITVELGKYQQHSDLYKEIENKAKEYSFEYVKFHKELIEFHDQ
jgi:HNH endonuclease